MGNIFIFTLMTFSSLVKPVDKSYIKFLTIELVSLTQSFLFYDPHRQTENVLGIYFDLYFRMLVSSMEIFPCLVSGATNVKYYPAPLLMASGSCLFSLG